MQLAEPHSASLLTGSRDMEQVVLVVRTLVVHIDAEPQCHVEVSCDSDAYHAAPKGSSHVSGSCRKLNSTLRHSADDTRTQSFTTNYSNGTACTDSYCDFA